MPDQIPPDSIVAIRMLFFDRLTQTNRKLIEAHNEIAQQIATQNHNGVLGLLAEVESRVHTMQTMLIVLRECMEGQPPPTR